MQVNYRKEKILPNQRPAGHLLATDSYVLEVAGHEIGYYYLAQNAHYFMFWDENSVIQHGLVDLWYKTISCSAWGGTKLSINIEPLGENYLHLTISDKYNLEIFTNTALAGKDSIYQLSVADVDMFSIDHTITKINQYTSIETGTIVCNANDVALLFSSFILLQLSFSIEC